MRNLTIARQKSFVASLVTMKVYIEDHIMSEITINGTPVRKIGDLKNGETKTFIIDNNACKVFVIADALSKNYCNEFYNVPEGEAPVFLTGKNHYNPANGNAFQFDGVTDPEVLKNRKKGSKKGIIVLIIAVIVGAVIGFIGSSSLFDFEPDPKDFSVSGMQITLTDEFKSYDDEDDVFTTIFESNDVTVLVEKIDFDFMEGLEDYTLKEFGEFSIEYTEFDTEVKLESDSASYYYQYEAEIDGDTYVYYAYIYKSADAFWIVQFAIDKKDTQEYRGTITEWADSVKF